jgi:hypothetical protein
VSELILASRLHSTYSTVHTPPVNELDKVVLDERKEHKRTELNLLGRVNPIALFFTQIATSCSCSYYLSTRSKNEAPRSTRDENSMLHPHDGEAKMLQVVSSAIEGYA